MLDVGKLLECGKETVALRIVNECKSHDEFAHIYINLVYVNQLDNVGQRSMSFYDNFYRDKHKYKGVTISCQMDVSSQDAYAFELGINSTYMDLITLEKAEESVKTLRTIQRKMNNIERKEGYCDSFEEFAVRFARSVNAKAFYSRSGQSDSFTRNDDIGELRSIVKSVVRDNIKVLQNNKVA